MSALFDQLRIVSAGFFCGAAFMIIMLALGGAYSF